MRDRCSRVRCYGFIFSGSAIQAAHFDPLSNVLSFFGLPLFAVLLWNSDISHKRGSVRWKGREYSVEPTVESNRSGRLSDAFKATEMYASGEHGLSNPQV